MKITEEYLRVQGFSQRADIWLKYDDEPSYYIQIREIPESDGFRLEVHRYKTKEFGTYGDNATPDNDGCLFLGYVTTTEEMETIIKACGIRTDWRKKMPFSVKRTDGKFKLYQYFEGKNVYAGFETNVYDEAMAEMKRRNKEFTTKIAE